MVSQDCRRGGLVQPTTFTFALLAERDSTAGATSRFRKIMDNGSRLAMWCLPWLSRVYCFAQLEQAHCAVRLLAHLGNVKPYRFGLDKTATAASASSTDLA